MTSVKRKLGEKIPSEASVMAVFTKAIKAGSEWSDKDEFLDVVYWLRQIIGLLIGIAWGVFPVKGIIGIILFFAVNMAVIYFFFSTFQKVDEEDYGGISEILKEGVMTSFATFIVAWIIFYSALHAE